MEIELFDLSSGKPFYNGNPLKIRRNSQGYPRVYINKKAHRLHRLVALKYIPNPKNKPIVDHINGDKLNFSVSNLQWSTYSENSKKAYKRIKTMSNMHNGKSRPIISTCNRTGLMKKHRSLRDCARHLNRDNAAVYRCLNGEWNNCNDHKLKYV